MLVIDNLTTVYHLIVLDESGSMACVARQTISGCNETLQTIKQMQRNHAESQRHFVSIYLFDSVNSRYIVRNAPIEQVGQLTSNDYRPNACTPLFDAMGKTLNDLKGLIGQPNTLGYVTVITDGYENDSKEYTLESVRSLIKDMKKRDVVFSFIGANIDAAEYGRKIGIDNCLQFKQDDEGTRRMWEQERKAKVRSNIRYCKMKEADPCAEIGSFSVLENNGDYYNEE